MHKDILVIARALMCSRWKISFISKRIAEYGQGVYCVDFDFSDLLPFMIFFLRSVFSKTIKLIDSIVVKIKKTWEEYARFLFAENAKT